MPALLRWLAEHWELLATAVIAMATLAALARRVWPVAQAVASFLEDWAGDPARPGVAAQPGVMERLQSIEQRIGDHTGPLRALRELMPNGGATIKDQVGRIDRRVEHVDQRLDALERVVAPDRTTPQRRARPESGAPDDRF